MSAIGREGGHSRGRTRQVQSGEGFGESSADVERGSYIGHASERESPGAGQNLGRNEQRPSEPSANRGEFGGRGQF
jgi:hypothetical protein